MGKTLAWNDWFANLETGDVLLGQGNMQSSHIIERVFGCEWSHAAIIVIAGDIGLAGVPPETVLCWESNVFSPANPGNWTVPDLILGKEKEGPMLIDLKRRVSCNFHLNEDTNYAHRKLNFARKPEMFAALKQVIADVHSCTFPGLGTEEFENYLKGKLFNEPITDGTFFCSQLAAHTFKTWGLIGPEKVDNAYCPANFSATWHQIEFLLGATLDEEITVDPATIPAYPGQG